MKCTNCGREVKRQGDYEYSKCPICGEIIGVEAMDLENEKRNEGFKEGQKLVIENTQWVMELSGLKQIFILSILLGVFALFLFLVL